MKRGILIIAAGRPEYGNYAHQLCLSIKSNNPDVKVACLTDPEGRGLSHVNGTHKFDEIIKCAPEHCTYNGLPCFIKLKTAMYWYSPFDETLFLDADILFFPEKNIETFMEQFSEVNFTMANRGKSKVEDTEHGFIHWANVKDLKVECKTGFAYNLSSELIWFKKCEDAEYLFMLALHHYDNPPENFKPFAGVVPDELPFMIAMMESGIEPHRAPFLPFFWEHYEKHNAAHRNLTTTEIQRNWWALSLGGNTVDKKTADLYNALSSRICTKFGQRGYAPCQNKSKFLPERTSI